MRRAAIPLLLLIAVLPAHAEFERELISERRKAGTASAKRVGKYVGRLRKLTNSQIVRPRKLIDSGDEIRRAVAAMFGVDVATLRRAVQKED